MDSQKNRVINLLLDEGGPIVAWKDKVSDNLHRKLLVTTNICRNPECPCRDVQLHGILVDDRYTNITYRGDKLHYTFKPIAGETLEVPPLRELSARLDVDSGEVGFSPNASAKIQDPELLTWLKEGLDQKNMDLIRKRWRLAKGINQDKWRHLDWSWWQPGAMISWLEVFPDDFNIIFKLGKDVYWADDLYCIEPNCGCQEVGLVFSQITPDNIDNLGAITVTLPSGEFSAFLSENCNGNLLRRLWDKLRKDKGRCALLEKRKKDMAPIGQEIVHLNACATVRSDTMSGKDMSGTSLGKVGRNDPCPCGSGKKYKKCCLGRF